MITRMNRLRGGVVRSGVTLLAFATAAMITEAVLESRERPEAPAQGELVDVGGGRRLYLNCVGTGAPTVMLAAGLGGGAESWGRIVPEVAKETRVCTFDKAGRWWSDDVPAPQDASGVAEDLAAALAGAGEAGPYVLVGHSFGGLYARAFAARYPERTAGLVLLDASDPEMFTRLPAYPGFYEWYRRSTLVFPTLARLGVGRVLGLDPTARYWRSVRDELATARASMAEAGMLSTLGEKPLIVVTALKGAQEGWTTLQEELVQLSSDHRHWSDDSLAHQELLDTEEGADISARAIGVVVENVRRPR